MKQRKLKTDPFQASMAHGTGSVSMSSQVSKVFSPMRNCDIKRCAKSGDWSELIEKALLQTNKFRRDFYK